MSDLVTQPTLRPTRKLNAVAFMGFISAIGVASIRRWAPEFDAPGITEFIPLVVAWCSGWFVKERA
jgi:hypothetical protein